MTQLLFKHEPFLGHSGGQMQVKVECDALTPGDWDALARIAKEIVMPFGHVLGVPRGGIPFADALQQYATNHERDPLLIADDVLTTGGSMIEFAQEQGIEKGERIIKGIVAFARDRKSLYALDWVQAVWVCPTVVP